MRDYASAMWGVVKNRTGLFLTIIAALFMSGCVQINVAGKASPDSSFSISTQKMTNVTYTQTADGLIFNCSGDIGTATIIKEKGECPLLVKVRIFDVEAIESFEASADNEAISSDHISGGMVQGTNGAFAQFTIPASALYHNQPGELTLSWVDRYRN